MKKYITSTEEETRKVGALIAENLKAGDIVLLYGDLGAGKTVVSKGIVNCLTDQKYDVTSPTFTIVNEYDGVVKVNHFDLYRITSPDELENIGIYEYLYSDAVCVFEWPERAESLLLTLENLIKINIRKVNDKTREIIVE